MSKKKLTIKQNLKQLREKRTGVDPLISKLTKGKNDRDPPTRQNQIYAKNAVHQMDLIYLPFEKNDNRTPRYLLVATDVATKTTDAQPVKIINKKFRTSQGVLDSLKTIYKRKILSLPSTMIETDSGGEFKDVFAKYLKSKKIIHKIGLPGRSRQQAFVEARNKIIAEIIFEEQLKNELDTKERDVEWVSLIPGIIEDINEILEQKPADPVPELKRGDDLMLAPTCKGTSCELLTIGTLVRRPLEKPVDPVTGQKLIGKFRTGDLRFEIKPRKIKHIILKPGNPPMYKLESLPSDNDTLKNLKNTAYTKGQLLILKEGENRNVKPIQENKNFGMPYKIVGKAQKSGKVVYLVLWKNFKNSKPIKFNKETYKNATFEQYEIMSRGKNKDIYTPLLKTFRKTLKPSQR